ncbi:hypothetical protein [Fructobacillus ficulneus]|uniref:DUF5590 domain-containing protein n=1 Tax=Fructobacillus ficulneus TaxID=157463 RepID=A0A0K8MJ22_9LACO|nr:hypothetical protein [Fructobacillus ficulneus]GAP00184.1 hypothetical protein FFIC_281940 [Fructobacillus ficulneus]
MEVHDNLRVRMARPKRFSWLKFWLITGTVIVLICAGLYTYAYISLRPMAKAEDQVQKVVSQKTDLTNLHNMTVDYRNGTTYAVLGQDDGTNKVAIVQGEGQDQKVKTFKYGNGLSHADLISKVKTDYKSKKIYSANLSVYQKTLVWEVSYEGKDGGLNYLTIDYKKGTVYRAVYGI